MRFKVEIDVDNSAFYESQNTEIARILRKMADDVEDNIHTQDLPANYRDINGNTVGKAVFTEK